MRGLFLDFEATDKDPLTARITQAAMSLYDLETKKELYHNSALICPEGEYEIHPDAQRITGITKEQLEAFGEPLRSFLSRLLSILLDTNYLIAHNLLQYDLPLLRAEVARLGIDGGVLPATLELIDTRFDVPWPEHIETRKLTYLGAELGVFNPGAHSARHDVDTMAVLFFKFPLDKIVERSKSPSHWVRADVTFDHKDKARNKRFLWDPKMKVWVKFIKEMDYKKEGESYDFKHHLMPSDYKGP